MALTITRAPSGEWIKLGGFWRKMVGGGIGQVLGGSKGAPGAPDQPALFPAEQPAPRRSRGRQAGSQNRNTKATRAWILSRFDNPLEGMCALALPADLLQACEKARAMAQALRCTVKEAMELMFKASVAANPYLNSAMPQDVNLNSKSVTLAIGLGVAPAPGDQPSGGLAHLRAAMLQRALNAPPPEAETLRETAEQLPEENQDKSGS